VRARGRARRAAPHHRALTAPGWTCAPRTSPRSAPTWWTPSTSSAGRRKLVEPALRTRVERDLLSALGA
jgi:hypothetical protein